MDKVNVFKEKSAFLYYAKKLILNFFLGLIITFVISIIFGYQYKLIGSGSMLPTLSLRSLVIVAPVEYEDLEIGDIITMKASDNSTSSITFTHRIVGKYNEADNKTPLLPGDEGFEEAKYWQTQGDNNPNPDTNPVTEGRVVGKVVANFNFVGYAITYVKSNIFLFTFFAVIFMFAYMIIA